MLLYSYDRTSLRNSIGNFSGSYIKPLFVMISDSLRAPAWKAWSQVTGLCLQWPMPTQCSEDAVKPKS